MRKSKQLLTKRLAFILFTMLMSLNVLAQDIKVQGIVKDETGEAVIGATVMQKGTSNGTVTDIDGNFSVTVPANATLAVSYIGFSTQEIPVEGKTDFTIVMKDESHALNEVVVVGYGTMRKSDLTGSVGSLSSKDMDAPVTNIGQAMQGKVAGLQVVDAGKPGDNVSIKIRGLGSINNCDPLVVIDGVPTDLGLNNLNMADVERLDVLKDIHLLNYRQANSLSWRDMDGTMPAPQEVTGLPLSVKITSAVKRVWVASPDALAGAPLELSFAQKNGVVTFTLPSLKYWSMIVIES